MNIDKRVLQQTIEIGALARWRSVFVATSIVLIILLILLSATRDFWIPLRSIISIEVLWLIGVFFSLILSLTARGGFVLLVHQLMGEQGGKDNIFKFFRLPKKIQTQLIDLADNPDAPFILCKDGCHTIQVYGLPFLTNPLSRPDPISRKGSTGFFHALNDLLVLGYLHPLNTHPGSELGEGDWFADFVTDWKAQQSAIEDNDLPLRLTQVAPYLRFAVDATAGVPKPKHLVYCCLSNPIEDPIYVLPTSRIIKQLQETYPEDHEEIIKQLEKEQFNFFRDYSLTNHKDEGVLTKTGAGLGTARAILKKKDDHYRSSFDINLLDLDSLKGSAGSPARQAIYAWIEAIESASSDSIQIPIKTGDVLILNNNYCMHRRQEQAYTSFGNILTVPKRRWLRRFMGFTNKPKSSRKRKTQKNRREL